MLTALTRDSEADWSNGLASGFIAALAALAGAFGAVFLERYVRRRGEIQCQLPAMEHTYSLWSDKGLTFDAHDNWGNIDEKGRCDSSTLFVDCWLDLRFLNEKEVGTGLYNLAARFTDEHDEIALILPIATDSITSRDTSVEPTDLINLPSQKLVNKTLHGTLRGEKALVLHRYISLEILAQYPDGSDFTKLVERRDRNS